MTLWRLSPEAEVLRGRQQHTLNELLREKKQEPATDYDVDKNLFTMLPFGHKQKHEFLIRCWNHQWPDFFFIERDGIVNDWHVRIARAVCKYRMVTLLGCASSGKTFVSAAYCYTRWKSEPFGTSVYLSTTSADASEARTWGVAKDLFSKDHFPAGKRIDSLRVITLDEETRNEEGEKERDVRNCVKAVLIKSGAEGKNVVGAICGRKNLSVIWHCDEAPFMDLGILDARVNLFSNPFAQTILAGNAPEEGDPLYIDAEPYGQKFPDGWRSVDKDVHEWWRTRTGICLYFNGAKSPNMRVPRGKPAPFPRLMDHDLRDAILNASQGEEDSPVFWKQFHGFPPTVDVPDKVVTHKLLESHKAYEAALWAGERQKVGAGLDLGFREDGDPCVIDFFKIGRDVRGRTVAEFERDGIVLNPSQSSKKDFERQIAVRVIEECRRRDCHDLALDISADGGMILQAIEREARAQNYPLEVVPVSFSGSASDSVVIPGDKRTGREMFDRMVTELWHTFRISVYNGVIRGCDPTSKAVKQLCARKFSTDDKKRFSIEKKSDMKKRIKRSPDHADARCVAHRLALKLGLSGMEPGKPSPGTEKREESPVASRGYGGHTQRQLYAGR